MPGSSQDLPEFATRFEAPERRGGARAGVAAAAVLAATASAGLAWWLAGDDRGRALERDARADAAIETPLEPPPAVAASAPAETPPLVLAEPEPLIPARTEPTPEPERAPGKAIAAAPPKPKPAAEPKPKADPCATRPTPAERLICGDAKLAAADRRMKQAYDKALAAGADREVLSGEQAAWRAARNRADDAGELEAFYERRMSELAQHASAGR